MKNYLTSLTQRTPTQELRAWFAGTEAQAQDEWLIRERSAVDVVGQLVNTFRWLVLVLVLVVVLKSWM